ncbi:hypothetical protein SAMN04488117_108151 [Celeribacter baekdonensis]|uniref:Uncharacterized protein n=1 Tax=Celeribacter baekdonensis TaxID=875171 RepID=A0A1G7PTN7_9RHOB|nr:hypothetical protein [Celeribacter baekdonensis]SDF89591.1 hypothetical protein SAMN04488117_108151 [Celeribacter baekdonensis]
MSGFIDGGDRSQAAFFRSVSKTGSAKIICCALSLCSSMSFAHPELGFAHPELGFAHPELGFAGTATARTGRRADRPPHGQAAARANRCQEVGRRSVHTEASGPDLPLAN